MYYSTSGEAWKRVKALGYMNHTYEWVEGKGWKVREMTEEEKAECQRERTALQEAHDDSLSNEYQKCFRK